MKKSHDRLQTPIPDQETLFEQSSPHQLYLHSTSLPDSLDYLPPPVSDTHQERYSDRESCLEFAPLHEQILLPQAIKGARY